MVADAKGLLGGAQKVTPELVKTILEWGLEKGGAWFLFAFVEAGVIVVLFRLLLKSQDARIEERKAEVEASNNRDLGRADEYERLANHIANLVRRR